MARERVKQGIGIALGAIVVVDVLLLLAPAVFVGPLLQLAATGEPLSVPLDVETEPTQVDFTPKPAFESVDLNRIPCPEFSVSEEGLNTSKVVYLAGLVRNVFKLKPKTIAGLLDLSCIHHVEIHILSGGGKQVEDALELFDEAKLLCFGDQDFCAPISIDPDPDGVKTDFQNRVDRIAYLRDHQREILRSKFGSKGQFPDVVLVADLELHSLPTASSVRGEIDRILVGKDHDVVCAAGLMHHPFGYYDTYATVLGPGTFVYPLQGRLVQELAPVEDEKIVRSDEVYGELTQEGLFRYLLEEGRSSPSGNVRVRSCFGGMAIYRASTWFQDTCQYSMSYPTEFTRYANIDDGRPCEHVIFHECILNTSSSITISIAPSMTTLWDEPVDPVSYLFADGEIYRGLNHQNGLVTSRHHPEYGLRLENGNFVFRINEHGSLVVEENTQLGRMIKWTLVPDSKLFREKWEYMFLTLADDGEIILSQQIKDTDDCPREHCFQVNNTSTCRPCRYALWSSKSHGDSSLSPMPIYVLHLGQDGILRVVDIRRNRILWQNMDGLGVTYDRARDDVMRMTQSDSRPHCIASGTQDSINRALSGRLAEAILCPNATFELTAPIVYTDQYQSVYTQGKPTGRDRAVLRIADSSLTTAVNMLNRNGAELSHVIVDGNRPSLGKADAQSYGEALILAGGESRGQIIRHIDAYEPRSWTALHVAEGDPIRRCAGALIESNMIGPAGDHIEGAWADGISMACARSIVRGNTITDATDVSLVLFGAPGSVLEDNVIIARTRSANGGITMVDYDPYGGNFSDSIVQRNVIYAEEATIGVAVAMGPRIWLCMTDEDLMDRLVWGGTVRDNVLKGDHMRYGFAIDGVRNWTVLGNVDEARHNGESLETCQGAMASAPGGFQIDRTSSTGVFQDEFEEARLAYAVLMSTCPSLSSVINDETHSLEVLRAYRRWQHQFPCYRQGDDLSGFFYVKVPKTASTTIAGVARRIVSRKGNELQLKCKYRGGHGSPSTNFKFDIRDPERSFLMTFVRDPAERALSSFFYHSVAKHGVEASDENFLKWAKSFAGDFQFNYIRLKDYNEASRHSIKDVLHSYDFIGITERMDESLVVLAMILGLDVGDILYMDAKRSGYAFTTDSEGNRRCVKLHPKQYSSAMRDYFSSEDWRHHNQADIALYKSVNRSLDLTIDALGRERFENSLELFRSRLRYSQEMCNMKTKFPCSADGILQLDISNSNCYAGDEGCGYPCLDEVASNNFQHTEGSDEAKCIPSGNQDSIKRALSGPFGEAILCPNATFELTAPITYSYAFQSLYTQGRPTGRDRAVLRIADSTLTTAVNMLNRNGAELSHVIVDGNRPSLGKADAQSYGEALILAGGESRGQIIRHIDAYEPRSWTALHVAEGDPIRRCSDALVENNMIGPAGDHIEGAWADGISMACARSIVRGNTITDATDVSLVLFGAPGSVLEDNVIVARTRSANGGITMVDYDPYGGNFSGSIVQRNVIYAETATIGVAVAMGPRIWLCMTDEDLMDRLVWGGTVRDNVLKGDHMRYGFAIDGVRNWTVLGNVDEARHGGESLETCQGAMASAPGGFQIDRTSSTGVFQDEFEEARFRYVASQRLSASQSRLHIALLMSFPNSGTTYTLTVASEVSLFSFATNYGGEVHDNSAGMYGDKVPGPFLLCCSTQDASECESLKTEQDVPHFCRFCSFECPEEGYILTKTHCGGYNNRLSGLRNRFWISKPSFLQDCLSVQDESGKNLFYYDLALVKRVVHLIRDPFDNIVSRFRHERAHALTDEEKQLYLDSPSGFRAFCRDKIDRSHWWRGFDSPLDDRLWDMIERVPCYTDFLRYVNWHNNAFELVGDAELPSLVIHYEQYGTNWNQTVSRLLNFFERPVISHPSEPFRSGKVYRHYFEDTEVKAIKSAFEALASEQTWSSLRHYFHDALLVENSGKRNAARESSVPSDSLEPKVKEHDCVSKEHDGGIDLSMMEKSGTPDPPCSYEILRRAFTKNKGSGGSASSECWQVENETPMIPKDAIGDLENSEVLGIGKNGIVHKASILLDNDGTICSVAMKTALCRNTLSSDRNTSCISSQAMRTSKTSEKLYSFGQSEYLGALLFVASQKAGLQLPGLVPTWGLVYERPALSDGAHDTKDWNVTSRIVGAVMPVVDISAFQPRGHLSRKRSDYGVATMILPAAEALLFAEKVGLSFQDIHIKNMGMTSASDHVFVFDNTYLSLVDNGSCSSKKLKEACHFCREDLRSDCRRQYYNDRMVRVKDCHKLAQTIISMLPPQPDFAKSSALFKDLETLLYSGGTCQIEDVAKALRKSIQCIPSGNQDSINRALSGRLAEAILCPNATFELTAPIVYTDQYQSVYTQGRPTGRDRAVLRIADSSLTTAVNMLNRNGAELSHVIVDGNRPSLGKVDAESYGEALILAGGESRGQSIRHIDAYEPRSWTALHVAEGDPIRRCSDALVENNMFGPAGDHIEGAWADGISMACTRSIVRGNTITDATDVSLVLFGAPGSVLEDNVIIARTRSANGGITMVDYDPYGGNFSGSIVQRNVIYAETATIGVAVAMGPRIWLCMTDEDLRDRLVWGGTVRDNVLKGDHMRYGFAIDGVRNWTVLGNVDEARHNGESLETCQGAMASSPGGFQIDRTSSTGVFQDEFEEARFRYVASQRLSASQRRLHIALLMSFPNSGTSYTLRVARKVSSISFATNYGGEVHDKRAVVYGDRVPGPFWLCCRTQASECELLKTEQDIRFCRPCPYECPNEGYILTKTHCGGDFREPMVLSKQRFLKECLKARNDEGKTQIYSLSLVKRVVHLIRDPFDNIVSRFRHERAHALTDEENLLYLDSPSGFRAFCRDKIDHSHWRRGFDSPVDDRLWDMIERVPCYTDFLRYVNWHNNAFEVAGDAELPSLVIHYENYGTNWNQTVSGLLDFLEQTVLKSNVFPFAEGKKYRHFYSAEEVDAIRLVFEKLASEQTWSNIRCYFEARLIQNESNLLSRLPFIFGPSTIDVLPPFGDLDEFSLLTLNNLDHLSRLAYEEGEEEDDENDDDNDELDGIYVLADVTVNSDGSLVSFAGVRGDEDLVENVEANRLSGSNPKGALHVKFAASLNDAWKEISIVLPPEIGMFTTPGVYIEKNGTVTMVLDTCSTVHEDSGKNTSCFTIIEAKDGCTAAECGSWTVLGTPNFLSVPKNCSPDPGDPLFECPCHVQHPTIWFDRPMQKWRMLMHQYPSRPVDDQCVPQPQYYDYAGGYAETVGKSAAGPWIYDYFQPAYGSYRGLQVENTRRVVFERYARRERPKIVLGSSGGLDGGYIVNTVYGTIEGDAEGIAIQPVTRSTTTLSQRTSGTIYLTYHAETSNGSFPLGIGPLGLKRAKYMASIFDGRRFETPKTIIAARNRDDDLSRGQRMHGTVIPLAQHLDIEITEGPLLVEKPYWTFQPARDAALQALEALAKGTVLVSWWSYTDEFCRQLGTKCDDFEVPGEILIIEVEHGVVVSIEETTDGFAPNYYWSQLPRKVQTALEILGYNPKAWNSDRVPEAWDVDWSDLNKAEQCAASELGFNEKKWNANYGIPLDITKCGGAPNPYIANSFAALGRVTESRAETDYIHSFSFG